MFCYLPDSARADKNWAETAELLGKMVEHPKSKSTQPTSRDDVTPCTELEVFLGKEVREAAQTAGANARGNATKKRKISCTSLPINLHF